MCVSLFIPVLKINDHATGGRRTKDILGGPKGWGPKKKVANAEIYVIFEVFAYCGGRTKTDFKDREGTPHSRMKTHWSVLAWRNVEVTKVLGASLGASCPRTDAKRRKANILQENFSQCWCVKSCHVQ